MARLNTISPSYQPGDIVIFFSDALYHSIAPWVPLEKQVNEYTTPGRVSWVFTTHKAVVEAFEKPGWEKYVYRPRYSLSMFNIPPNFDLYNLE